MLAGMNLNPPTRIRWDPDSIVTSDTPEEDMSTPMMLNVARAAWVSFVWVFGDALDLATGDGVARDQVSLLQTWIIALEKIARGLLLMMAFAIAPPPKPDPAPKPRVLETRTIRTPGDEDVQADEEARGAQARLARANPDAWHVSLAMFSSRQDFWDVADDWVWIAPAVRLGARAPRGQRYDTFGIARRAEAVLRIFNDPEPFAQRLALRLSRLWAPLTFPEPPVRYLKPISIDYDAERAPPRPGPYDHWTNPARRRCIELAAAYWASG
jgi:hypothetical protein